MAIQFFTRENAAVFMERLNKIQPTDQPKFGQLTPTKLMRHLRFSIDMSIEKEKVEDISNIFTRSIIRLYAFHWFTEWPGGKIKAPDYFTPETDQEFDAEKSALHTSIQEFLDQAEKFPDKKSLSPLFGKRTLEYWRRIHGIHFAHHCKQYGV